eukprot:TRINITY_DN4463_c0_g3_i2.p1 TRINITY_DN4463_c0_g3~~TRINITY_DN4463_c0_g3_i2.p1  ORF type:complete len:151 (-),score=36.61 TRINITY_DN4463_c0_g3_i2:220-672(-)
MIMTNSLVELADGANCTMQFVWLTVFGLLFILTSLRVANIDSLLKFSTDFLYRAGFKGFFLIYMGTLQLTWWYGIVTGVFCFLAAIFNYYVMTTHPYFDEEVVVENRGQQPGGDAAPRGTYPTEPAYPAQGYPAYTAKQVDSVDPHESMM